MCNTCIVRSVDKEIRKAVSCFSEPVFLFNGDISVFKSMYCCRCFKEFLVIRDFVYYDESAVNDHDKFFLVVELAELTTYTLSNSYNILNDFSIVNIDNFCFSVDTEDLEETLYLLKNNTKKCIYIVTQL